MLLETEATANGLADLSDGSGNATFTFIVDTGWVWSGTVYIDGAPAAASFRVTRNGRPRFGTGTGGQALQVEGQNGDQIVLTATGLTPSTPYTAVWSGNKRRPEEVNTAGWLAPFPGTTH